MSDIQLFNFNSDEVRVVLINEECWFVASDIANVLEISSIRKNLAKLDDDEKGVYTIHTPGGNQEMSIVNEPGLYQLVFTSRKPQAKQFKRWLVHEVLPAIRKTGEYSVNKPPVEQITLNSLTEAAKTVLDLRNSKLPANLIQCFEDAIGDKIITNNNQKQLPEAKKERWLGAAQRAEELGYKQATDNRIRCKLGKFVKARADDSILDTEERLVNGSLRTINVYLQCEALDSIIHDFFVS